MKKQILFSLLFIIANAHAFSNVIIFGDSLSDIGNFPESKQYWDDNYKDSFQNYYIPPTNPLPSSQKSISIINKISLPSHEQNRKYTNYNWSHIFINELLGANKKIIPSTEANKSDSNISVNYAWWSAVSHIGCFNENYELIKKDCNLNDIIKAKEIYNANRVNRNKKLDKGLLVPGLLSQIKLHKQDVKQGKVYKDNNTLYVIFIGGNGIYDSLSQIKTKSFANYYKLLLLLSGSIANDISKAVKYLAKEVNAKNILVVNLHDLSLTPRVVETNFDNIFSHFYSVIFNKRLSNALENIGLSHINLYEYDYFSFFNQIAHSPFFKASLGEQCDHLANQNMLEMNQAISCLNTNKGYLYWNNSHPSALAHIEFGYTMAKSFVNNKPNYLTKII